MVSCITSIEDVGIWFKKLETPTWNLYRGWHDKMPVRNIIYKQEDENLSLDESFEVLQQMMEMNSHEGGKFTVYVHNNQKGSSILVGLNLGRMAKGSMGLAGYSGAGFGMVPADEVDRKIAQALELNNLKREIEDLRAAQEAGMGFRDILIEKLREVDLGPIITGLSSLIQPRAGAIQGMPAGAVDARQPNPEPDQDSGFSYDGEKILPALDNIRPHFDRDTDFYSFIEKVSARFAENPDMFKNMI